MKQFIVILLFVTVFYSCKNDSKTETANNTTETTDNIRQVTGNFIYYADAAVLQTKSELFGVIENEKMKELVEKSKAYKNEPTDEVVVTLKVKVSKKPENEEGWENRVDIIDIVSIAKANPDDNDIIKLGNDKNVENQ
ncbi:MAG: hypothetical protein R2812_02895 [Gelidibacter sp.]